MTALRVAVPKMPLTVRPARRFSLSSRWTTLTASPVAPGWSGTISFAQVVSRTIAVGGQALASLERLDRVAGGGAEDAVDRDRARRARGGGPGWRARPRRGCRGSGSGRRAVVAAGGGRPGSHGGQHEQGEGDRQEAARSIGMTDSLANRRAGAGASRARRGAADRPRRAGRWRRRPRSASRTVVVARTRQSARVGPTESALDPAGEERATERVARHRPCRRRRPAARRSRVRSGSDGDDRTAGRRSRSTSAGPRSTRPRAAASRRRGRREVGEVVDADLDDVGAGDDRAESVEVGRPVGDDARPAVRIEHHERPGRNGRHRVRDRGGHRLQHEAERADVERGGVGTRGRRAPHRPTAAARTCPRCGTGRRPRHPRRGPRRPGSSARRSSRSSPGRRRRRPSASRSRAPNRSVDRQPRNATSPPSRPIVRAVLNGPPPGHGATPARPAGRGGR